jgi:caffeoyl-CoA O-methyltransferase
MATSPEDKGFGQGSVELKTWAERVFHPEDAVLAEIRARSVTCGLPAIAVGKMDGLHLEVLARAIGARRAVEIGTLGGYSGVCLLRGMGEGGRLHTFEIDPHHAEVARESFTRAGVAERVRFHLGPATERLRDIETEGPFDLVFVDADKVGYPAYLDWAERNLRVGGVVLLDNAFGWGHVAEPSRASNPDAVRALAQTAEHLASSTRWRATMLPTAEGLAMGVKVK